MLRDAQELQVSVAEAVGWTDVHRADFPVGLGLAMIGHAPPWIAATMTTDGKLVSWHNVPPYGEDSPEGWAALGPLLERYGLEVSYFQEDQVWMASPRSSARPNIHGVGPTAIQAICDLIVRLADCGCTPEKLELPEG